MAKIVIDVVADTIDDSRLHELYRIGVDEVSYRRGHRYLSVVADHDREGAVVWVGEARTTVSWRPSTTSSARPVWPGCSA